MNKANDIYQSRINKVIDYVNNNIDRSISLEELAAVACFSPFHFHRVFVAVTGETVNNFTARIRSEKAARLLKFSKKRIASVAIECGFSSASALSRQFKQYFSVSPTGYRKGEGIKNSKIRQQLFPVNRYHCGMTVEELEGRFPVAIKRLPQRRIAYIRVMDAFTEGLVLRAFERLLVWAKQTDLYETQTIFGMSMDDPEVTPKENYRYEVCITLPAHAGIDPPAGIETTILPACMYAVTSVQGDLNMVAAATNYLFDNWLINSRYECEPQHALELFKDKSNICNWEHFDLELLIPVKLLAPDRLSANATV